LLAFQPAQRFLQTKKRILKQLGSSTADDLDKLSRLIVLSWLSSSELELLSTKLRFADFTRSQVVCDADPSASEVRVLLRGIARITYQTFEGDRVTIALIAPGLIPEFHSLPGIDLRCEAYGDCRVGSLSLKVFNDITVDRAGLMFDTLRQNDLRLWHRLLLCGSSFSTINLHERVAITMFELSSDFGIKDARGLLLPECFTQRLIAELVGASRPRVTEHLAQLEYEKVLLRQGRQFIVRAKEIQHAIENRGLREVFPVTQLSEVTCNPLNQLKVLGVLGTCKNRQQL